MIKVYVPVPSLSAVQRVGPDWEQLWRDRSEGLHLYQILRSMVWSSMEEKGTNNPVEM